MVRYVYDTLFSVVFIFVSQHFVRETHSRCRPQFFSVLPDAP